MRSVFCLVALAAAVAAQEGARTLEDGVLKDPFWNLTFKAPGLKEAPYALGGQNVIFEGNAGDLKVQILVYEVPEKWDGKEWKTRIRKVWGQQNRKLEDVEEADDAPSSVLYVHESLAGFRRHHGHAWYPREYRCFEVHAEANEKSETSGAAIRALLKGLALGEEKGNSLAQVVLAKRQGKTADDPIVILASGESYVQQSLYPVAVPLFERAAALIPAGHYDERQQYFIHEMGGLSILSAPLRDGPRAIPWHTRAEDLAKKTAGMEGNAGQSAYNLACAYSLSGKLDEAFAALRRAFAYKSDVVTPEHLASDPDLDALRADPRWEAFGKERTGDTRKPEAAPPAVPGGSGG